MLKLRFAAAWLCALAAYVPAAAAQDVPKVYTYIAEFTVPRAQWGEFGEFWKKSAAPVLDRLLADGKISEYGADATVVHVDGVGTHSFWWSASSFAGTQIVMPEIGKLPQNAALASIKHRDRLLVSLENQAKPGSAAGAYLQVSISYLKPGKGQQWRQLYNKYTKPVMEQLLSDGTLLGYGIDREYVHTESPGARYEWLIARDAGALDKVDAAFEAARAKHSAEAGRAIAAEFAEAQEPGTHRDALTQIIDWKRK